MTEREALRLSREVLAPFRRGTHVSSGAGDITRAVADALWKAAGRYVPNK